MAAKRKPKSGSRLTDAAAADFLDAAASGEIPDPENYLSNLNARDKVDFMTKVTFGLLITRVLQKKDKMQKGRKYSKD